MFALRYYVLFRLLVVFDLFDLGLRWFWILRFGVCRVVNCRRIVVYGLLVILLWFCG